MRDAGSGTILDRGKGRYLLRIRTADGKRRARTIRAESLEDARRQLDNLLGVLTTEGQLSPGGVTVRGWLAEWLRRRERSRSWKVYDGRVRNCLHDAPWIDDLLVNLRPRDVRDYVRTMLQTFAPATAQGALSCLKMALREAVEDERIAVNPAREIRLPRADGQPRAEARRPLTRDEVQRAMKHILPPDERAILAVAIFTGLRSGELFAMQLDHVHERDGQLLLHVEFGGFGGKPTKSGKPRWVRVVGPARTALKDWLDEVPRTRKANADLLLFPGRAGGRRRLSHASTWLRLRLRDAGVMASPRFHDLRHTAATALENGWFGPPMLREHVQAILGHATMQQTAEYSGGATEAMLKALGTWDQTGIKAASQESENATGKARTAPTTRRRLCSPVSPAIPGGSAVPDPGLILTSATREIVAACADGSATPADLDAWRETVLAGMPEPWRSVLALEPGPHRVRRTLDAARMVLEWCSDGAASRRGSGR